MLRNVTSSTRKSNRPQTKSYEEELRKAEAYFAQLYDDESEEELEKLNQSELATSKWGKRIIENFRKISDRNLEEWLAGNY